MNITQKRFGKYGGQYVPEILMPAIQELEQCFFELQSDAGFRTDFENLLKNFVGRPTALTFANRLSEHLGGAQIYLKREDLAHTGAHKINNALGQALLAKHMGKKGIIAETGAGQHGVASAVAAARLGLDCKVFMGKIDMQRQEPNVHRMRLLGAEVIPVTSGTQTLKDAVNEAFRFWAGNSADQYYLLGSALGPFPYPLMVREFQSVIGTEARRQMLELAGRLPDTIIACVGGGSNAIGMFHAFVEDSEVNLIGVEAGGLGIETHQHAARFADSLYGKPGVLHGSYSWVLQDEDGQIMHTHSISAGLDYASVGPEHAALREEGRASYTYATDREALEAFHLLSHLEGILPALESSHALAHAIKIAPEMNKNEIILVNLSGRGDKDLHIIQQVEKGDQYA